MHASPGPASVAAAGRYIDYYAQILKSHGLNVTLQNRDIITDFATLFHAPLVFSMESSFVWLARVCADPDTTFMSGKNWQDPDVAIDHGSVHDYHDTDAVIALMNK